ncbi:tetratricopeptide repeat protein [Hyphomicrobium sp. ghe19]|uniref:tetratricopeptide repeat protein n=1 Tax=Hyphomicrobium sp. ghe19 TaxID=2682968 RepID=UPI0030CE89D3
MKFNLIATSLDYLATRSPTRARARANRLSEKAPTRAFELFASAAGAGDVEAAFIVGECYLEGKGILRQPCEAARWYRRAAVAGHARAQCRLAQLHLFGLAPAATEPSDGLFYSVEEREVDYCAAELWARRAAETGNAEAQALLGYILSAGPDELCDAAAALEWYRKSAEQDCAQGRLGYVIALMKNSESADKAFVHEELVHAAAAGLPTAHYLLGVEAELATHSVMDESAARQHYEIAAAAGHGKAQMRLGLLLIEGRGGSANAVDGESWLRRAALGGDIEAASQLGDMYARGGALPPNYAESAYWFRTAAERGDKWAARSLGMLYLTGAGVGRDPDEAASWFKRAAVAGDVDAQGELALLMQTEPVLLLAEERPPIHEWFERRAEQGDLIGAFNYAVCLAQGLGVPPNEERAAFWLERAAKGVVQAQFWYGRVLASGSGVAKDEVQAAIWLARAAEGGMGEAQLALAELQLKIVAESARTDVVTDLGDRQ